MITQDGISKLVFAEVKGDAIAPLIRLTPQATPTPSLPDAMVIPSARSHPIDVSVTRNGRYAIARQEGSNEILLVDLQTKHAMSRRLSSPITDLDLWHAGSATTDPAFAFAVLREEDTLVKIAIPDGFADLAPVDSWKFSGETIGSVSVGKSGKAALLYTTALANPSAQSPWRPMKKLP